MILSSHWLSRSKYARKPKLAYSKISVTNSGISNMKMIRAA